MSSQAYGQASELPLGAADARRQGAAEGPRLQAYMLMPERRFRAGAVVLFDVDDLGSVNDDHGIEAGDALLAAIELELRGAISSDAKLLRLDRDRFLLWLPAIAAEAALRETRRLAALAGWVDLNLGGLKIRREVSAGLAVLAPTDRRRDAIVHADRALRQAKRKGGRSVALASSAAAQDDPNLRPSREEVLEALRAGAFSYHLQPIVTLGPERSADRVTGVEALLRWEKPDGAVLLPDSFLGPLERSGSQTGLDPAIAVKAARSFLDMAEAAPITWAFNITGAVLDGKDMAGRRWIETLLEALPPERLVFEVVESAVIRETEAAFALVTWLRALGAKIALDDFGTGVSGLDRLRDLPVDLVKVDRSFVRALGQPDRRSEGILMGLVAMGRAMGFEVLAEGIEDAATLEAVRELGVAKAQGFHLGRPGPAPDWAERLRRS